MACRKVVPPDGEESKRTSNAISIDFNRRTNDYYYYYYYHRSEPTVQTKIEFAGILSLFDTLVVWFTSRTKNFPQ